MAGITLSIEVDDKGSVKVKQFSDQTKKAFDEMKKGPEEAKSALTGLQENWIAVTAKITASIIVLRELKQALKSVTDEAAQAEEIENRLRFALETTGYTWQYAKTAVDQFANSIQDTTRFSDEQARQALIDMTMYTSDFGKAQEGARLAMDMSVRTGMDLITSARYIGMAMSGNVEMLGRYIPQLRNLDAVLGSNATMSEKASYGLKVLREMFGGTAPAEIGTYTLKVAQMKNAWSDLKEMLGNDLIPVLKTTFEWLTKIMKSWKGDELENLQRQLSNYQKWLEYGIKQGASTAFLDEYRKRIEETQKAIERLDIETAQKKLKAQIKPDILPESTKIKDDIQNTFIEFHKLVAEAYNLSEAGKMPSWEDSLWSFPARTLPDINALNLEFNMLIANAEKLSMAGEMPDWRESLEDVQKGFVEIEGYLYRLQDITESFDTEAAQWVKDWVANWKTGAEQIEDAWKILGGNISSAWNFNVSGMIRDHKKIGDSFKNMCSGMADTFINSVSKMIYEWLLFGSITGEKKSGGGFLYGGSWSGILGSIAGLFTKAQEGGIFTKPTAVLAGEVPEAFVPLKNGKIPVEGSGGGNTIIYMQVEATDVNSFERRYGGSITKIIKQGQKTGDVRF
jgi:hypothetical protein